MTLVRCQGCGRYYTCDDTAPHRKRYVCGTRCGARVKAGRNLCLSCEKNLKDINQIVCDECHKTKLLPEEIK